MRHEKVTEAGERLREWLGEGFRLQREAEAAGEAIRTLLLDDGAGTETVLRVERRREADCQARLRVHREAVAALIAAADFGGGDTGGNARRLAILRYLQGQPYRVIEHTLRLTHTRCMALNRVALNRLAAAWERG